MTQSNTDKPAVSHSSRENIPCAKCRHENPPGSNTCESCQAHLWVVCHHCGVRSQRAAAACGECGHRLHRSVVKKASRKFFGTRQNISPWHIGALAIGVWLAYKLVIFFAEYRVPPPE